MLYFNYSRKKCIEQIIFFFALHWKGLDKAQCIERGHEQAGRSFGKCMVSCTQVAGLTQPGSKLLLWTHRVDRSVPYSKVKSEIL